MFAPLFVLSRYPFQVCSGGLLTNFHQPDSTLLLLVAAFLGGGDGGDDDSDSDSNTLRGSDEGGGSSGGSGSISDVGGFDGGRNGGRDGFRQVYQHAIEQEYQFLSYGDACLLHNAHPHHPSMAAIAGSGRGGDSSSGGGDSGSSGDRGRGGEGEGEGEGENARGGLSGVAADKDELSPEEIMAGAQRGEWEQYLGVKELDKSREASPMGTAGAPEVGAKVLLHSCCAPCSGAMVEEMVEEGLDVTIYFYNPNIHPREEYEIRKEENKRFAVKLGIPFVDADYDVDEWYKRAEGMEWCPERGTRCSMCFDMRMERTALHCKEHGFTHFTTTNATSRWKDEAQVNASGIRAAARYGGGGGGDKLSAVKYN